MLFALCNYSLDKFIHIRNCENTKNFLGNLAGLIGIFRTPNLTRGPVFGDRCCTAMQSQSFRNFVVEFEKETDPSAIQQQAFSRESFV